MFSEGPPKETSRPFLACGKSYAPPILDTVGASLWALILAGSSQQRPEDATDSEYHGMLVTTSVWLAVQTASAAYGYVAATRCNDARLERSREMATASILPPPYGAGVWGRPPATWPPPNLTPPPAPAATLPVLPPPAGPDATPPQPAKEPQVVPFTP
jgi:hypothetical protein